MGEEQDLNPEISGEFFENKVLSIDQSCLTENGMEYVYNFYGSKTRADYYGKTHNILV